jgi:hypothetical protein
MIEHGRSQRGEVNWNAMLTADDVVAIRLSALTSKELAQQYGVSPRHIRKIKARETWKHL